MAKSNVYEVICRECGVSVEVDGSVVRRRPEFCSRVCKTNWHNRRRQRGAVLYDLYMASRYERQFSTSEDRSPLHRMSQVAAEFRDEDRRERDGRPSWDYRSAVERIDSGS